MYEIFLYPLIVCENQYSGNIWGRSHQPQPLSGRCGWQEFNGEPLLWHLVAVAAALATVHLTDRNGVTAAHLVSYEINSYIANLIQILVQLGIDIGSYTIRFEFL